MITRICDKVRYAPKTTPFLFATIPKNHFYYVR